MKKILFMVLLIGSSFFAQAQATIKPALMELTLEAAIMQQRSSLAPERINNLQWISGIDELSKISKDGSELLKVSVNDDKVERISDLKTINAALGLALKSFPRVSWTNKNEFYFRSGNAYYSFNAAEQKGSVILELPEGAANVDFDPTVKMAAYTIDNNLYLATPGTKQKTVFESKDANIVTGQAIARYEFGISKGTFWSSQNNLLAYYQKDETDVADYPLLDMTVTPGKLTSIKYPMAGQKSEYGKVGIYDPATNRNIFLDVEGPRDQYLTNLAWSPDEAHVYVAVVNREQNHMWLNKYDASTGKLIKTLFEEKHPKYVEPENPVWFIPEKSDEFMWMSERDGFMHVYQYHTDGRLIKQVTEGNWVVEEILGLSRTKTKLIVRGTDESGLNMYAYSINLSNGKRERLSDKSGIHNYQLSDSGMFLTDYYSSLKTPYVVDIITSRGKISKNLLAATDPLNAYKIGTTEIVQVKAEDGTELHARIIKPSNFNPSMKYPVLVYVYGGPHAQMVSNRRNAGAPLWMHYMAEKGYIIFTLDNRGSKSRGFEFENIIHRQCGTVEMEDQIAGVDYLKKLPYVDANRMAVHGWSYGGFMTASLMLRKPGVFKVGVAGGPVTDWKFYEIMYGERYMDTPKENPEGYSRSSLMTHAKDLEGDLLLIHGTVDDVVVMQHNYALVQKFVEEGILVDFFPYPNHPHNVRGKDRVHLMDKVLTYVEEKLK